MQGVATHTEILVSGDKMVLSFNVSFSCILSESVSFLNFVKWCLKAKIISYFSDVIIGIQQLSFALNK